MKSRELGVESREFFLNNYKNCLILVGYVKPGEI